MTTVLTIYSFGLRGNSAYKSIRKHRFWTQKPRKAPEIKQKIGIDFFGTRMSQVQILSFRPKNNRFQGVFTLKSVVFLCLLHKRGFFDHNLTRLLLYLNYTVRLYGNLHSVLHITEELVTKSVNNRHCHAVNPNVSQDCACGCK